MSRRPPSQPPQLPGYEHERLLGSGGFADVFLYRQLMPRRKVAIKVLISGMVDARARREFDSEANTMAAFSDHPAIVSIFQADVASDGRPYIVMEYAPGRNYGERFRTERIGVAEALSVGVQIAGAVETAHRAGVLHRDIKPANILTTAYGKPALTDFGIAATLDDLRPNDGDQGLSIPWSPPELFEDAPHPDRRTDVYSLAATVFTLLAGRTPFEEEAGRNSAALLVDRIQRGRLQPIGRPDVPEALERVLAVGMSRLAESRYSTALSFGRALQQIEMDLSLPVTSMDVLEETAHGRPAEDEGEDDAFTRIRPVTTIDPATSPASASPAPATAAAATAAAAPRSGRPAAPPEARPAGASAWDGVAPALGDATAPQGSRRRTHDVAGETVVRRVGAPAAVPDPGRTELDPPADDESPPTRWGLIALVAALALVVGLGAVVLARTVLAPVEETPVATWTPPDPGDGTIGAPADVTALQVQRESGPTAAKYQFAWTQPDGFTDGDQFQWRWGDLGPNYAETPPTGSNGGSTDETSIVLTVPLGAEPACFEVRSIDPNGPSSDWVVTCVSPQEEA